MRLRWHRFKYSDNTSYSLTYRVIIKFLGSKKERWLVSLKRNYVRERQKEMFFHFYIFFDKLINSQASLSNLIEVKTIFYIVFLPLAFAILFFLTLITFWSCAQVTRGDLNPIIAG
jgi:hypothetical protein